MPQMGGNENLGRGRTRRFVGVCMSSLGNWFLSVDFFGGSQWYTSNALHISSNCLAGCINGCECRGTRGTRQGGHWLTLLEQSC